MFRKMRRNRQELSKIQSIEILNSCTSGVLSLIGDEGYPYGVPISYAYYDDKLYFHCAKSGHKLDAIKGCSKASFCVIYQDQIVPEKYTTFFKSVIAFGKVKILDGDEMDKPIRILCDKYVVNGSDEDFEKEYSMFKSNMYILEFSIEHLTGKQCKELIGK